MALPGFVIGIIVFDSIFFFSLLMICVLTACGCLQRLCPAPSVVTNEASQNTEPEKKEEFNPYVPEYKKGFDPLSAPLYEIPKSPYEIGD